MLSFSKKWQSASMKLKPGMKRLSNKEREIRVLQAFQKEKNFKDEVDDFFTETSFTALVRIYKATSVLKRLMWTLTVLVMVSWLVVQCFWLLDKYFKYPVEVKMDLTSATHLEFPSVTICNLNPVLSSVLHDPRYQSLAKYKTVNTDDVLYEQTKSNWQFHGSCDRDEFECSNGQCVGKGLECDGNRDCYNNDDEDEHCLYHSCNEYQFKCMTGRCIPRKFICDGVIDCPSNEDEHGGCGNGANVGSTNYFTIRPEFDSTTTGVPHSPLTAEADPTTTNPTTPDDVADSLVTPVPTARKRKRRDASGNLVASKKPLKTAHNNFFRNILKDWAVLRSEKNGNQQGNVYSFVKRHLKPRLQQKRDELVHMGQMQEMLKLLSRQKRSSSDSSGSSSKRGSSSRSVEKLDWNKILQSSNFSKWDQLAKNGSTGFYKERDDEYEATMMYAYITALMDDKAVEQAGHQKNDFIASCQFGGYKCSPQNFTYLHNYKYGNCFTFNTKGANEDLKTKFPGPSYGLVLELFINTGEYVANLAPAYGARVSVHKKGTTPFPEDQGFSIMTARSTNVGIRQVTVTRLPPPHGVCADVGKTENYYMSQLGHAYTKLSCLKSCYQDLMVEYCGCQTPVFFVRPGLSVCNMTQENVDECVNNLPTLQPARYAQCDLLCPVPCSESRYETSLSQAQWPSPAYAPFLTQRLVKTNSKYANFKGPEEFTRLQIYFADLMYQHIEQQKAYESMNLISDLGGQLGLWLGLSAITLGELCSFLLSLGRSLPHICCGKKKRVTDTPTHLQPATLEEMYNDLSTKDIKLDSPPEVVTADMIYQTSKA